MSGDTMWNPDTQAYLSDDVERKLLQQAVADELRFRPLKSLRLFFNRLFDKA